MTTIRVEFDDRAVQAALENAQQALGDLTPAMSAIGEYMVLRTEERFDQEQSPSGQPWAPLTTAYLEQKRRKNKILKILQREGDLIRTIVYNAEKDFVEVGTNRDYGEYHQFGTSKMPARPYLGVNPEDEREIAAIIEDYLRDALGG